MKCDIYNSIFCAFCLDKDIHSINIDYRRIAVNIICVVYGENRVIIYIRSMEKSTLCIRISNNRAFLLGPIRIVGLRFRCYYDIRIVFRLYYLAFKQTKSYFMKHIRRKKIGRDPCNCSQRQKCSDAQHGNQAAVGSLFRRRFCCGASLFRAGLHRFCRRRGRRRLPLIQFAAAGAADRFAGRDFACIKFGIAVLTDHNISSVSSSCLQDAGSVRFITVCFFFSIRRRITMNPAVPISSISHPKIANSANPNCLIT